MNEKIIGNNIRNWRLKKGLTLTETATAANLTKSALSKIETGQISPPISTVLRIGQALSVSLSEFFSEPRHAPNYVLTRKGQGQPLVRDGSQFGYSYEALALEMPGKKSEPFMMTIKPSDQTATFQHGGDEFMYILSGRLKFTIAGEAMTLGPGDSLYFNPRHPHSARALGKEEVRFLAIFIEEPAAGSAGRSRKRKS
jgi:transcriptional regulator with XRE-family HTH domain